MEDGFKMLKYNANALVLIKRGIYAHNSPLPARGGQRSIQDGRALKII